jgi:DNA (cytosine-5)-methyltransferase 1
VSELTHLSLFSGIGGIDLAAEWAGFTTIAQVEWSEFPRAILRKRFPDAVLWRDVREVQADDVGRLLGNRQLHLISGGYPCQPFSLSAQGDGRRLGGEDERHMWPYMRNLVRDLRPVWVLGENVKGHVTLGLDTVISDLEDIGYTCRAFVLPAAAVGAPHLRERVFVLGNTSSKRRCREPRRRSGEEFANGHIRVEAGQSGGARATQPVFCGNVDGVSAWLDGMRWPAFKGQKPKEWEPTPIVSGVANRTERIHALGNAVVPAQVYPILAAIAEWERRAEEATP